MMADHLKLVIPPRFKKRLGKKPPRLAAAIIKCVQQVAENPGHPGLETHRVRGVPGVWEAYVDKSNRVTFHYDNGAVVFRNHCNHDIISRRP